MSRYHSYIANASKILHSYNGDIPFSFFLKHFFSKEKKFGSSDRKVITGLCYNYFRVGIALNKEINEENLLIATFLCNNDKQTLLQHLKPEWQEYLTLPVHEKMSVIKKNINLENLFPFRSELSQAIEFQAFKKSFLIQPCIFIRTRPGKHLMVLSELATANVNFKSVSSNAIQLPPATKIENLLSLDEEAVIQDYNSQQVLNYLSENRNQFTSNNDLQVWDACAASGGKSILLADILQNNFNLTVSDIRSSIMNNLKERFKRASIKKYHSFVADLTRAIPLKNKFDIIICDTPCTGSGTWSRTPEQLYFFDTSLVDEFSSLQKKIVTNTIPQLKPNGFFFYITCSVFKKENETVVQYIQDQHHLQLIEMKTLAGYDIKADSMFVAVFKNTAN